ncbi:MAG: hypothetical protein KAJ18_09265 [Candidatus Omnitrophica bacterium]|nr:hypothetical protein [Candidatus Omnitrophota bacterium]
MSEVNVSGEIKKFVELQKIDQDIYSFKRGLKEKPVLLEELKNQFEAKKVHLKEAEDNYKVVLVDRQAKEVDLQAKEDAIAKANIHLSQIKTNKEYTAKISEIEGIKADKSIIEEKILLSYEEADKVKEDIDKEKAALAQEEKLYSGQKKEIEDAIKEMGDKIKALESQRSQVIPEVDKASLERYERILENKDGLAIVPVQGSVCGGCFMNVPAQVVNEIKMHDKLVYCEMCARILYLEEDVE